MSHDLGSARRHHLADILRAYETRHMTLADAVDAIELDVFGCEPPPEPPSQAAALVTTAVSVLLVGRNQRPPAEAVELGAALVFELAKRGFLPVIGGDHA